jgi:hypothetical protein
MSIKPEQLERQGVSIVTVGQFNPLLFHPFWFAANDLIRSEEAEAAEIDIIHRQATSFKADWFTLQVDDTKISFESVDPGKFKPLRDLVFGTFATIEDANINQFGLNRNLHYQMPSKEAWHAFGHFYTPKDSWSKLLENPGMLSLSITGKRSECEAQAVTIKIEPSLKVRPGVYIHVNQHYDLTLDNRNKTERASRFLKELKEDWDSFIGYTDTVASQLFADVPEPKTDESN